MPMLSFQDGERQCKPDGSELLIFGVHHVNRVRLGCPVSLLNTVFLLEELGTIT